MKRTPAQAPAATPAVAAAPPASPPPAEPTPPAAAEPADDLVEARALVAIGDDCRPNDIIRADAAAIAALVAAGVADDHPDAVAAAKAMAA